MALLIGGVMVAMVAIMLAGWIYQRGAKNGGWTDVFWTYGTGVTCALAAAAPVGVSTGATWRRLMIAAMVAIWAGRLGTYVARRVARGPEDARYAALRREWGPAFQTRMFVLLIIQAPITAAVSLSVLIAARRAGSDFGPMDGAGLMVFVAALAGEAVADLQLKRFKTDARHASAVCDRGLWSWSRHPNYVFEALIWWAYPLIGFDPSRPWSLTALVAPILMFWILRYGTGVPPLERAMLQSKGDAYRRYQARVSIFMPWPPSEGRSDPVRASREEPR